MENRQKWDDLDVYYLANTLSIEQLQGEIASIKRKFPYEDWHGDFIEACKEAMRWIRASQPKPIVKAGSRFPDLKSLKNSIDIIEIASRYTRLIKSGRNFKGICPLHSEKKPSFMVYPDQQSWHCFGACNAGGDVINLVMKAEHADFKSAIALLGGIK